MLKLHTALARHARAGSGDPVRGRVRGQGLRLWLGLMSTVPAMPTMRGIRAMAAWLLLLASGWGGAQSAWAGSLPEPIIDPTMAAVEAQRAAPGGTPPAPSASRTALTPGAVSGPMPQRQLPSSFQPAPIAPGALKGASGTITAHAAPSLSALNPVPDASAAAPTQASTAATLGIGAGRMIPAQSLPPPSALESSLQETLQRLALAGARQVAPASARVEVELGRLDPRLRLAPCDQIQPYLPPNQRMWGRTRIGIRCLSGPTKWNVSLPLTIRVFAPAYVAVTDLPVGTELTQERLRLAETDIAGEAGVIFTQPEAWVGRHLAKGLMAGEALRSTDLKLRQWVQPGDRVQVQASGDGYAVSGEGQAMGVGLEGQDVRIRFDNGRMVTGRTVGERKVEVLL